MFPFVSNILSEFIFAHLDFLCLLGTHIGGFF